jgi:membrane-associated protein
VVHFKAGPTGLSGFWLFPAYQEVDMSSLFPLLLHWLHEYGYPMLWLTVFIAAVGIPLPISLVLLAVGAFAGYGDFNIMLLIVITITASSCGDNVGYFIGRSWGSRTLHWLVQPRRVHVIPAHTITRSRLYFKRRGGWAIFFSRFLFSALGGVMSLLAGAERYPYRHFLLYDVTGETLGAVIPLSLGYALGACWEAGGDLLGALSGFAFILFLVMLLVRRLVKTLPHSKETLVAYPAVSTQKLTVNSPLPKSTSQRITGVRRQNIGEQMQEVPYS